ncbi:MAG: hypothetical protein EBR82_52155 [Caulobacteraceae bacterium]|nr:hypothetical protein [Caulobacteraceae bacterium]
MKTKLSLVLLLAYSGVTFSQTLLFKYTTGFPADKQYSSFQFLDNRGLLPDPFYSYPLTLKALGNSYLAIFLQAQYIETDAINGGSNLLSNSTLYIFDLKGNLIQKIDGSRGGDLYDYPSNGAVLGVDQGAEIIASPNNNFIFRGYAANGLQIQNRLYVFNKSLKRWNLNAWTPPSGVEISGNVSYPSGWGVQHNASSAYWVVPSVESNNIVFSVYRF